MQNLHFSQFKIKMQKFYILDNNSDIKCKIFTFYTYQENLTLEKGTSIGYALQVEYWKLYNLFASA